MLIHLYLIEVFFWGQLWLLAFVQMFLSSIFRNDHLIFLLRSINLVEYNEFLSNELSLHSWLNSTSSWLIFLMCGLMLFANVLLRIFPLIFISEILITIFCFIALWSENIVHNVSIFGINWLFLYGLIYGHFSHMLLSYLKK